MTGLRQIVDSVRLPFLAILILCISRVTEGITYRRDGRFTSDVNLEHYYILEGNVLSHADILLRDNYFGKDDHESEEDHAAHAPNLTEFRNTIQETKKIHEEADTDLHSFLAHPVNMYHLFKRLSTKWKECLNLLLKTTPCRKWNVPIIGIRLRYMHHNLPGEQEMERMIHLMSMFQRIHGFNAADVSQGSLGGYKPLRPLSLADQYRFVNVFRDREDMVTALAWLGPLNERLKKAGQEAELGFNRTHVLLMMASAHFHLKDPKGALKATEEALKLQPNNSVAKANKRFFTAKLSSADPPKTKKYRSRFERDCAYAKPKKLTKKKCMYIRVNGLVHIKAEVLRIKPKIMLFHDVFKGKTADTLQHYAHSAQIEHAWQRDERYVAPDIRVQIIKGYLQGKTLKGEADTFWKGMRMLGKIVGTKSRRWGNTQVVNVGLEGIQLSYHDKQLGLVRPTAGSTGAFFTFLNTASRGGEAVFDRLGIIEKPSTGSVLYYMPSEWESHGHCPVLGTTLWLAVQTFYEDPKDYCVPDDEWKLW